MVAGAAVPVKIVAAVTDFPDVSGPGGAVITDLAALQDALAASALPPARIRRAMASLIGSKSVTTYRRSMRCGLPIFWP